MAPLLQAAEPGAETLALAAEVYLHNRDPGNAEAYFERAAKLNPNDTRRAPMVSARSARIGPKLWVLR